MLLNGIILCSCSLNEESFNTCVSRQQRVDRHRLGYTACPLLIKCGLGLGVDFKFETSPRAGALY
jgi:hypothetical protein